MTAFLCCTLYIACVFESCTCPKKVLGNETLQSLMKHSRIDDYSLMNIQLLTDPLNPWPESPVVWDSDYYNLLAACTLAEKANQTLASTVSDNTYLMSGC